MLGCREWRWKQGENLEGSKGKAKREERKKASEIEREGLVGRAAAKGVRNE